MVHKSLFGPGRRLTSPPWTLVLTAWGWVGLHSWFSQQILACVIGSCTVAIVGLAGRQIGGERVGLIAAGIAALYAGLWVYERALLSETLMMLIIAVLIFVAYRFNERPSIKLAALLGVLAGLLSLSRSEQILVLPFVIAPLILTMKVAMWRRRVGWLALAVSLTLVVLAPWTIYNQGRLHRFVPLSDNFAGAVLQGNCPVTYYGPYTGYYSFGCLLIPQSNDQSIQGNDYLRLGLTYAEHHLSRLPLVLFAREGRAFGYWDPFQGVISDAQWEGTPPSRQDLVTNAKALTALGLQPNGATSYVPTATWVGRIALFTYWVLVTPAIIGAIILRRRRIPSTRWSASLPSLLLPWQPPTARPGIGLRPKFLSSCWRP